MSKDEACRVCGGVVWEKDLGGREICRDCAWGRFQVGDDVLLLVKDLEPKGATPERAKIVGEGFVHEKGTAIEVWIVELRHKLTSKRSTIVADIIAWPKGAIRRPE